MSKQKHKKPLIWVYPPNNWQSDSNKTFVYGYSNPTAKLFVSTDDYSIPQRINIFPNGNFAKSISLPGIENKVRLIQISGGKKTIIKRKVFIKEEYKGNYKDVIARSRAKGGDEAIPNVYRRGLLRRSFAAPRNDMILVIDPGHGGKECGTHSPKGIPEKHYNLQIAKLLHRHLSTRAPEHKLKIYLTRSKDKFVSLNDRVDFAKKVKCNLFISIHHNALPDKDDPLKHCGVGIYYTNNFVKPLAVRLLNSISQESGLKKYGVFKRDFRVTGPRFYKGVLIECGFLTHPIEAEYIIKKETQEKIVRGIVKAII